MKKTPTLSAILFYLILSVSCSNNAQINSNPTNALASQSPTPRQLTLDEEANQEARNFWNNLFSKCGESSFWLEGSNGATDTIRIFEGRGPMSIKITGSRPQQRQLSKAEELNQVGQPKEQWIGKSSVEFEVWRYGNFYDGRTIQWLPWKDKTSDQYQKSLDEVKQYMPKGTYEDMQSAHAPAHLDMKKVDNKWQFQAWGITHPLHKIDCDKIPSN